MSRVNSKQAEIDEIFEGWGTREIGECFEVCTGKGIHKSDRRSNGAYPIMGANGVIGYSDEFLVDGDYILMGRVGTLGEVSYNRGKSWISDNSIFIGNGKQGDLKFLYYYLKTFDFQVLNVGSTQPLIKQSDIKKIKFPFLPIIKQRAIAKILSDLDEKIELNRQMNKTLESICQAIFKRWFVDFEFLGHEKTKFVNDLPEGWHEGCLADILEVSIGGDWGNDKESEGMVQAISLRGTDLESLKSGGYAPEAPVRWIRKDKLGKRIIKDSDILIGGSGLGPIGKTIYCSLHLNGLYAFPVTYSNFCKRLTAKTPGFAVYAERILENMYLSGEMNQFYTGTSIPNLDVNSLIKFPVIIPTAGIVYKFYEILTHKFMKLFNKENALLSQIRDSLLPKLISGKIRVS